MKKNNFGGLFVAVDGPNGVGKSTLIRHVKSVLSENDVDVYVTKEPTDTPLGSFTRQIAESIGNESLTCLVAADRYQHLNNEIIPELTAKHVVITDRYILSSLILQRMDSVDAEFILAANKNIILPDLQIVVTADEGVIQTRLNERKQLTRFEQGNRTSEELMFLEEGVRTLCNFKVKMITIDNSSNLFDNVSIIAKYIAEVLER